MAVDYDAWKTYNPDWDFIPTSLCFQCADDEYEFKTGEAEYWVEIEDDDIYEFCCQHCLDSFLEDIYEDDSEKIINISGAN